MMDSKDPPAEPRQPSRTKRQQITDSVLVAVIAQVIREVIDRLF